MEDKKLDPEMKSSANGDVSAGETTMLSKDEQHLAKLGYKQGMSASRGPRTMIDTRDRASLMTHRQSSSATSGSSRPGPQRTSP